MIFQKNIQNSQCFTAKNYFAKSTRLFSLKKIKFLTTSYSTWVLSTRGHCERTEKFQIFQCERSTVETFRNHRENFLRKVSEESFRPYDPSYDLSGLRPENIYKPLFFCVAQHVPHNMGHLTGNLTPQSS